MQHPDISKKFTDQLYAADITLYDEQGQPIAPDKNGFLGLLALGYQGVVAWRRNRGETHLFEHYSKNKKGIQKRYPKRNNRVKINRHEP